MNQPISLPGPNPDTPQDAYLRFQYDCFWTDLLFEKLSSPEAVREAMTSLHISEGPFWPVLIRVKHWNQTADWRKRFDLGAVIVEMIYEQLHCQLFENGCVRIEDGKYIAILRGATFSSNAALLRACEQLHEAVEQKNGCTLSCYTCPPVTLDALPQAADLLMEADENNVTGRSLVPVEQNSSPRASIALPDMKQWYFLLSEQKYDQMLMELKNYFLHDNVEMPISRTDLMQVLQDFDQMLYVLLRERSISARLIFATEQGTELRRNAPNSVSDTMTWCFWAVTQVSQHLMQEERGKNYIEQVKTFIQQHLNQAFTRQDIADYVHLSQNHLARLFKKETGMSISDYIIQERMNRAFELLQNTNLPVGEVALRVGYENYSYFLTLFRRVTDLRPSEYRARHQAQKGDPTWTEKH